jgi:hypothetical protein
MDIGRLQPPEPGGRKDSKVESSKDRDSKRLEAATSRPGRALEAQDSVSFSPEAIELRGEVEAYVEQLRQREAGQHSELDPEEITAIRQKLEDGHYAKPEVLDAVAKKIHRGLHNGAEGLAQ